MWRLAIPQTIERFVPEQDCQPIVLLSSRFDFPFDTVGALELALIRIFCVPSTSALLDRISALALRGRIASLLPPRRQARLRTAITHPSYPAGYRIEDLGPPTQ